MKIEKNLCKSGLYYYFTPYAHILLIFAGFFFSSWDRVKSK